MLPQLFLDLLHFDVPFRLGDTPREARVYPAVELERKAEDGPFEDDLLEIRGEAGGDGKDRRPTEDDCQEEVEPREVDAADDAGEET